MDPRKDAHSTLLSKKETSNLYKIQCEWLLSRPSCLPRGLWGPVRLLLGLEEGLGHLSCPGSPGPVGLPHPSVPQKPRPPRLTARSLSSVAVHNVKPECLDAYNGLT